jgi:hypothetical protein
VALLLAAILAIVSAFVAPRNSRHRSSCLPSNAHTLMTNENVRIYTLTGSRGGTYACVFDGGHTVALATKAAPREAIAPIALAGTTVGYGDAFSATDVGGANVAVLDVASGHQLIDVPATTPPTGPESFSSVLTLVVTRGGAVAWIGRKSGVFEPTLLEVHSARSSHSASLLDQGPNIVPDSLRVSGGTVYWQNANRRAAAPLR